MRRGRPRINVPVKIAQVKLRLYPGADDDLLEFFAHIPPHLRVAMVKQALRTGVATDNRAYDQDQMFDALDSLVS